MRIQTLLDHRFETMGFLSVSKSNNAAKRHSEIRDAKPMQDVKAGPLTQPSARSSGMSWLLIAFICICIYFMWL